MELSLQQRRTVTSLLIGAGVGVLVTVVFLVTGGWASRAPALAAAVMFLSLVIPCLSIAVSGSGNVRLWLRGWLLLFGGCSAGVLLVAGLLYSSAVPAAMASLTVVGAAASFFGVLSIVIGRLVRASRVGAVVSSCCLLLLVATPFWSRGVMNTAFGARYGRFIIGSSPYLASAMPWVTFDVNWSFDPRAGNVLYDLWIGTDIPVVYPSWYACAFGFLIAGGILLLAAELASFAARRYRAQTGGPDSPLPQTP